MDIVRGKTVPVSLRECVVRGNDDTEHSLDSLIAGKASLLLFVRHFGCIGCSENVGLLSARFKELSNLETQVILVGCGPTTFIDAFRERHHLLHSPAQVYSDPTLNSHRAAGLLYGLWGGFQPRALWEMGRAFVNGHVSQGAQGDIRQHAGAILIDAEGTVHFYHRNNTLGDHANAQQIVDSALTIWMAAHPEIV